MSKEKNMSKKTAINIIKYVLIPDIERQIKYNEELKEKFKENKEIHAYHTGCLNVLKDELETMKKLLNGLEKKEE